ILLKYQKAFVGKVYTEENNDHDILMDVFGITPDLKRENRQYWGRELGMCWELLIMEVARLNCADFQPREKTDADSPMDFFIGKDAIDTKYRVGSGDSGTLKKFKKYGKLLKEQGYNPVLLILREDNLPAAITAFNVGGWEIFSGKKCLEYIESKTSFNIEKFLLESKQEFKINRS
ncbi:hypothetical protein N9C35_03940, partial [Flavobacteriaceae bacterium]|nr:hypothetical protein [Flavobacteriaceae bacterium]